MCPSMELPSEDVGIKGDMPSVISSLLEAALDTDLDRPLEAVELI